MRSLILATVLSCLALTGCELFDAESTVSVQVKQGECTECTDCSVDLDVATDGVIGDVAAEASGGAAECDEIYECDKARQCENSNDCSIDLDCEEKPEAPAQDGGPN